MSMDIHTYYPRKKTQDKREKSKVDLAKDALKYISGRIELLIDHDDRDPIWAYIEDISDALYDKEGANR